MDFLYLENLTNYSTSNVGLLWGIGLLCSGHLALGVHLAVWTQQLHHTMTSCDQSAFTFLSATLCSAMLLESVPAKAFVEHKSLGTACSNSMPGTAGTATRLDLHLERDLCQTSLELNTSREPEPGHSCMQAGPALRNFAGEHFPLLTSRPCVFNLLVVLRFGFRHDGHHAHILALQGFDHHVGG